MEANQILLDPSTMEGRSNEYRRQGEQIGQIITHMDSMLSQLKEEWKGAASEAYADRYHDELRPNFEKAVQLTNEIANALHQTSVKMAEQDRAIASGFRA